MIRKAQPVSVSFVKSKSLSPTCQEASALPTLLLPALGPRRLTSMRNINWFPCPWLLVGFGQWGNLPRKMEGSEAPFYLQSFTVWFSVGRVCRWSSGHKSGQSCHPHGSHFYLSLAAPLQPWADSKWLLVLLWYVVLVAFLHPDYGSKYCFL